MPRARSTRYPLDLMEQAQQVLAAWREATGLQIADLSADQFAQLVAGTQAKATAVERLTVERTKSIEVRDAELDRLWDTTRRVRNAAKATYGDDSQEVRKFGAVPVRSRQRKPKPPNVSASWSAVYAARQVSASSLRNCSTRRVSVCPALNAGRLADCGLCGKMGVG